MSEETLLNLKLTFNNFSIPSSKKYLDANNQLNDEALKYLINLTYEEKIILQKALANKLLLRWYFYVQLKKLKKTSAKNDLKNNIEEFKSKVKKEFIFFSLLKQKIKQFLTKEIFNQYQAEFNQMNFEQIVKISFAALKKETALADKRNKKTSIKSNSFLIDNFKFEKRFNLFKAFFEYIASKKLIKLQAKNAKRIIKQERIIVSAHGDYFTTSAKNKTTVDKKQISANVKLIKTEAKSNLQKKLKSCFNFKSKTSLKERIRSFRIERYSCKQKIYQLKKDLNWNYNLLYKLHTFKLKQLPLIWQQEKEEVQKVYMAKQEYRFEQKNVKFLNNLKSKITSYFSNCKAYFSEVKKMKSEAKIALISRKALKNEIKIFRFNYKGVKITNKYNNSLSQKRNNYISLKHGFKEQKRKKRIIYHSMIEDIYTKTPVEVSWTRKYISAFLSLLLPGSGQIYNRQYVKGIFSLLIVVPILAILLTYVFGLNNVIGNGIFGLIDLGLGSKFDQWDKPDSRFFVIEGTIAVVLMAICVVTSLGFARDAFLNGLAMEKGARCKRWIKTKKVLMNQGYPLLASFPSMICLIFIIVVPILSTFFIAFTNFTNDTAPPSELLKWVGWDQFRRLFSSQNKTAFLAVLSWTVIWTLATSLISIFVGFFYAIILNHRKVKFKGFIRIIFLLPWAIPGFVSILFFKEMFKNTGVFAQLFKTYNWYLDPVFAKILLLMVNTWLFHTTTFLMATGLMQSISSDLYEAAKIDGAGEFRQSFKITIPILLQQMAPILIGAFVGGFNSFGIIFMLTDGGPNFEKPTVMAGTTDTLVSMVFKLVRRNELAFASTLNIILTAGIILIPGWAIARTKVIKGDAL